MQRDWVCCLPKCPGPGRHTVQSRPSRPHIPASARFRQGSSRGGRRPGRRSSFPSDRRGGTSRRRGARPPRKRAPDRRPSAFSFCPKRTFFQQRLPFRTSSTKIARTVSAVRVGFALLFQFLARFLQPLAGFDGELVGALLDLLHHFVDLVARLGGVVARGVGIFLVDRIGNAIGAVGLFFHTGRGEQEQQDGGGFLH